MAHFKVYENTNSNNSKKFPYLLDIQSNLLEELRTTVVIPLAPISSAGNAAMTKLCPIVEVEAKKFVVLTQQLAGIDRKVLGKQIGDLTSYRTEVIAALDFLISGI